ncbi:hypothetical protein ACVIGB_000725 [Bradyrhizobium sp. USDA 4341]
MPKRIQRVWTKGWKKPDNAVYVGRGSLWSTPFREGEPSGFGFLDGGDPAPMIPALTLEKSLEFYQDLMGGFLSPEMHPHGHQFIANFRRRIQGASPAQWARTVLRGKDLMCSCPPGRRCETDLLLELANRPF